MRSEETLTQNHYRQRQLQPGTTPHEWLWVTTLEPRAFPTPQVRRLGHDRWKLENNGWNDLTQHWALKHGFLHACRHRPQTISPSGARQPVPNRGLAAVTLILLLAFTLCSAFTLRHFKLFRRYRMTGIEVAGQLRRSLCKAATLHPRSRLRCPRALGELVWHGISTGIDGGSFSFSLSRLAGHRRPLSLANTRLSGPTHALRISSALAPLKFHALSGSCGQPCEVPA